MAILAPLLPDVHAPLTAAGRGMQGGRLLEVPDRLARALLQLAGGTDPTRLLNPDWHPHQLRFGFVEAEDLQVPAFKIPEGRFSCFLVQVRMNFLN